MASSNLNQFKDRQQQLLSLECPFTWDLCQCDHDNITWNLNQTDEFIPELTFTRFLISAYIQILKMEYDKADEKLKEAEHIIDELKSLVKKYVARHIFDATKAHFLMKKGNLDQVDEMLQNIKNINDKNYFSSLNELKASAWTHLNYCTETTNNAIKFARIAIEHDPEAATSHYLLGRNLRTVRKYALVFSNPGEDEIYHFSKAYQLEKNPQFGLFVAQFLKENKNYAESLKIFKEIDDMNLRNVSVQLRLALVFLHADGYLSDAKKCLDYVESVSPKESVFQHHKGIYLMKIKKYEEAAKFLLEAAETLNYRAEMTYFDCMRRSGIQYDLTAHLLKMREKYSGSENSQKKEILLNIAFCQFYIKKDLEEAVKYFLLALEIEGVNNFLLKKFRCQATNQIVDVVSFLTTNLLPMVESQKHRFSEETILATEKLKTIFELYSRSDSRSFLGGRRGRLY